MTNTTNNSVLTSIATAVYEWEIGARTKHPTADLLSLSSADRLRVFALVSEMRALDKADRWGIEYGIALQNIRANSFAYIG